MYGLVVRRAALAVACDSCPMARHPLAGTTDVAACSTMRCSRPPAPMSRCAPVHDDEPADNAPRYSDAAGVENHPQVTDFVPRRYRTIAVLVLAGVDVDRRSRGAALLRRPVAAAWYAGDAAATFDLACARQRRRMAVAVVLLLGSARDVPDHLLAPPPPHRRLSRPISRLACRRDCLRAC